MGRKITRKHVQHRTECVCGHNEVENYLHIGRYRDLIKADYKRKIDPKTGQPFWFHYTYHAHCTCYKD